MLALEVKCIREFRQNGAFLRSVIRLRAIRSLPSQLMPIPFYKGPILVSGVIWLVNAYDVARISVPLKNL